MFSRLKSIASHFYYFFSNIFIEESDKILFFPTLDATFIVLPKTGSSSINASILSKLGIPLDEGNPYAAQRAVNDFRISRNKLHSSSFTFTVVRNPFDRLVSCYKDKVCNTKHIMQKKYFGLIYHNMPFDKFVRAVCLIPDCIADIHFKSQHSFLYDQSICLANWIGHYENLAQDFEYLAKRLDLPALPHLNNSQKGDWKSYYTPELEECVARRYQKDFELFGYKPTINEKD